MVHSSKLDRPFKQFPITSAIAQQGEACESWGYRRSRHSTLTTYPLLNSPQAQHFRCIVSRLSPCPRAEALSLDGVATAAARWNRMLFSMKTHELTQNHRRMVQNYIFVFSRLGENTPASNCHLQLINLCFKHVVFCILWLFFARARVHTSFGSTSGQH